MVCGNWRSGGTGILDIINLLKELREDCNACFLVVVHRSSEHDSQLQRVLQREVRVPVQIAATAETLRAGVCYIGEPAELLTVSVFGHVALVDGRNNVFRNQTVDLLFESVAEYAQERAIGVVLSGSLDDGSRGLAAIHRFGGVTMVLRPEPGERGMQQNAINYDGPVGVIGSSSELANAISEIVAG